MAFLGFKVYLTFCCISRRHTYPVQRHETYRSILGYCTAADILIGLSRLLNKSGGFVIAHQVAMPITMI